MKTYSRLTLAFLLLILVVPQVGADDPPKDGKHVVYYKNGQKESEGHYKDGKLDGLLTDWYENGKKEGEGNYKNGKEDGLATQWDEDGNKTLEIQYKDGKEVSYEEF